MGALAKLFDLSGRVTVVTGGSRGLGFQIAAALGEYGAELVLVARKRADLDEAVATLEAQGVKGAAFDVDLGAADAAPRLADCVKARFGRIDILVNNAGATWEIGRASCRERV